LLIILVAVPIVRTESGTIRGIATLSVSNPGDIGGEWDSCAGRGSYSGFSAEMGLSIVGDSGEIVGSGDVVNVTEENLDEVVAADMDAGEEAPLDIASNDPAAARANLRQLLEPLPITGGCVLYFEAEVEPSSYYSIELGRTGALRYSQKELARQGYVVGITVGGPG